MRYVQTRGTLPPRPSSVVEMPSVVVHRVERCTTGLDGPSAWGSQSTGGSPKYQALIPPWTVMRKVYTESLTSRHSGISNDILLFSDIGLSLAHHYRVHKRGVPHVTFRKNYMSQFHALLSLPAAPLAERGSPEPGSSSRPSRHTFARRRITRVRDTHRRVAPRLTEQDPLAATGAMVFDCRPQVLPGAMDISGTELTEIRSMTRPQLHLPNERSHSGGGGRFTGFNLPGVGRSSPG